MKKCFLLVLGILLACCIGCTQIKSYVEIVKDKTISKEYLNSLDKWTRDKTVYSQFETKVRIAATYKSSEFNKAYLSEYSRIYSLTEPEKKSKEEMFEDLSSDFTEFLFYAYTPDKDSNDFDKRDSIWTVYLLDEKGNRIYPVEVRKVKKITPVIKEFYPYINKYYGIFYSLKYPPLSFAEGDSKHLKLIFASVLGRVELEWPQIR